MSRTCRHSSPFNSSGGFGRGFYRGRNRRQTAPVDRCPRHADGGARGCCSHGGGEFLDGDHGSFTLSFGGNSIPVDLGEFFWTKENGLRPTKLFHELRIRVRLPSPTLRREAGERCLVPFAFATSKGATRRDLRDAAWHRVAPAAWVDLLLAECGPCTRHQTADARASPAPRDRVACDRC